MRISAERLLDASRETVWAALNDVEVLRRSIPGCEKLEWLNDEALDAQVHTRIGPIDTRFKGRITVSERDPPKGYRLAGEGQGGAAGFASGSAVVRLDEEGGGTRLQYQVDATVGGKLAQIGSRLIDAATRKFADDFFERFAAQVAPVPPAPVEAAAQEMAAQEMVRSGLRPILWVPTLIVLVVLMLFLFGRWGWC